MKFVLRLLLMLTLLIPLAMTYVFAGKFIQYDGPELLKLQGFVGWTMVVGSIFAIALIGDNKKTSHRNSDTVALTLLLGATGACGFVVCWLNGWEDSVWLAFAGLCVVGIIATQVAIATWVVPKLHAQSFEGPTPDRPQPERVPSDTTDHGLGVLGHQAKDDYQNSPA